MTHEEKLREVIAYWMDKARESLAAAHAEMTAQRFSFAVNRIYYACFYAVSAVLLKNGFQFKKHSGVRASFHKHLVKSGLVNHENGALYDELFEARQRGDYIELVAFDKNEVEDWLKRAEDFIEALSLLIRK
jgi:uncharacterized protein (UPF0332 family)